MHMPTHTHTYTYDYKYMYYIYETIAPPPLIPGHREASIIDCSNINFEERRKHSSHQRKLGQNYASDIPG